MDTLTRQPATSLRTVELKANPQAVRTARSYVADVLAAWQVPEDRIDTARLLTSELAANAVTHGTTAGGTFTLQVRSLGCCLSIEVHDTSPQVPVLRPAAADAEHGRGLLLVAEAADSWGYYFENGTKHVWFHLHITGNTADRGRVLVVRDKHLTIPGSPRQHADPQPVPALPAPGRSPQRLNPERTQPSRRHEMTADRHLAPDIRLRP